jgi:hypothetical protein
MLSTKNWASLWEDTVGQGWAKKSFGVYERCEVSHKAEGETQSRRGGNINLVADDKRRKHEKT